jgi:anti-anti-sigma regulatory factor
MIELKDGWQLHQDTSPDWLFFHLTAPSHRAMGEPPIAETIAREATNTGIKRVIVDFDEGVMLFSYLVGQLVALHKRMLLEGGAFRVCGLSHENADVLRVLHLSDRLPNYRDRGAAVIGHL